jgi:membrane-bound lytic murein transglycosylase D
MQSVENNNNVRTKNPLFVAMTILAVGALLLSGGCRTKGPDTTKAEPPPTAIMPPSAPVTNEVVLTPPPAQPDFKTTPPPMTTEPAGGLTYTVKNGDSLGKIAAHYGVSSREIAELNNISNPNKIRVGQKLVLPAYAKEGASHKKSSTATAHGSKTTVKKSAGSSTAKASTPVVAGEGEYVVKAGDSLSKIAVHLHVKVKDLREVNSLKNDNLKVGQKLKIPGKSGEPAKVATPEATPAPTPAPVDATPAPAPAASSSPVATASAATAPAAAPAAVPQTFEVTVDPGETLDTIAAKYGVMPADIKKLNSITEVAPGQKIKLPLPTP